MTLISKSELIVFLLALAPSCAGFKPVDMSTDPNRHDENVRQEKMDNADIEAFIAAHPELDAETKKELRDGTLTRSGALHKK